MASKIQVKRGTTAQWADSSTNDITLAPGQPGVEYCTDGKTKLKIGPHTEDGSSTEWAEINYISAEGAEMIKTSTTGKNYTMSDCAEETIVSLTAYGESTQDGTPTPDSPVEIVSIENPVISVYGKNLFDKDTMIISGAYVSGMGQYQTSASSEKTAIIPVPKNSTVTFSKIVTSILRVGLCTVYPTSGTQLVSFQYVSNKMSFTAATGNNSYLVAFFYNDSGETVNYEEAINSIQLEIGSTVTNYEPYTVQTVTVPYTFRGLKNTTTGQWSARDELRVGDGKVEIVRNVGTYTFNGTETWNLLTSETPSNIWTLHLQDKTIFAPNQYCLSSKLQGQVSAGGKTYANNSIWLQNTDQFKRTYIALQGKWTSVVTAKQWLASNNIDIQYVNLTPEIEDITATEAGQALLALKTNYPSTSVISDIDCNIEYLTVDSTVDQKYNPNSVYPQSGRAVAEAIQTAIGDSLSINNLTCNTIKANNTDGISIISKDNSGSTYGFEFRIDDNGLWIPTSAPSDSYNIGLQGQHFDGIYANYLYAFQGATIGSDYNTNFVFGDDSTVQSDDYYCMSFHSGATTQQDAGRLYIDMQNYDSYVVPKYEVGLTSVSTDHESSLVLSKGQPGSTANGGFGRAKLNASYISTGTHSGSASIELVAQDESTAAEDVTNSYAVFSCNGQPLRVTGIGTPTGENDAVNKGYIDNFMSDMNTKPCGITGCMRLTDLGTVDPSAGEVQIKFDTTSGKFGNIGLSSDLYAIQIAETGYYYVDGQVMFNEGVANKYMGIRIVKNGDTTLMDAYYSMGSINYGCVNSAGSIIHLTAGDTISLYAKIPAAGIVIHGSSRTKLTVFKLYSYHAH